MVGDKDIAYAVRARTSREQYKTATEERMARVGDLDFCQVVDRWVVDRGIKMFGRCLIAYPFGVVFPLDQRR